MSHNIHGRSLSMRAIFLVLLFAAYYCGSTLFAHSHYTWHGLVTHSHPFSPKAHHSHTDVEFNTIAALNNIVAEESDDTAAIEPIECLLQIFEPVVIDDASIGEINARDARAPPYFA